MREIKFKGLQSTGKWVYGYFFKHPDNDPAIFVPNEGSFRIKAGTDCQYIGIKDMNGVEVYEGDDILIHWSADPEDTTLETVSYDENGYYKYGNNLFCELTETETRYPFEVKGNIYESNP